MPTQSHITQLACVGGVLCHTFINNILIFKLLSIKVLFIPMLVYLTYDPYQIETDFLPGFFSMDPLNLQVCDKIQ